MDFTTFSSLLHRVCDPKDYLNQLSLEEILGSIPRIDELTGIPSGTTVLLRAELDMPIKNGKVVDMSRIETNAQTIKYCHEKGWKLVLLGHLGRDPQTSVAPVCKTMSEFLNIPIKLIHEWLDEKNRRLQDEAINTISSALPGSIFMLQNARKYSIEQSLWTANDASFPSISLRMYEVCNDIRERLTSIEINEAIAASNIDFSSSAIPLVMEKTAMGFYIAEEMKTHIQGARKANAVVFSGLKINKLDDLEGVLDRGNLKMIIAAGSLAMALKKAQTQLDGKDFFIGLAETDSNLEAYVSPMRIMQSKQIVQKCIAQGVDLILPVDFVLDDGTVSKVIPEGHTQMDIGPETRILFEKKMHGYIKSSKSDPDPYVLFFNGVFGKFEESKFEEGTKSFIQLLGEATKFGISTYVGGGEGRLALAKYSSLNCVTHAFTAGGTVLKSLTNEHIAYLKAMYLQNTSKNNRKGGINASSAIH